MEVKNINDIEKAIERERLERVEREAREEFTATVGNLAAGMDLLAIQKAATVTSRQTAKTSAMRILVPAQTG